MELEELSTHKKVDSVLKDYRRYKELFKNFSHLFSGELTKAEEKLFKKMKSVKDSRKEKILQHYIDPDTLDEDDEEDKLIKDFIRRDKIDKMLYKFCEFW